MNLESSVLVMEKNRLVQKVVCVLGLGYIGLPTALLFAQNHRVIGVDINKRIIEALITGDVPFDEPGLTDLLKKTQKNFFAKTEVEDADVFLIAVPTPLEKSTHTADLKYVRAAAEMIYPHLKNDSLVVLESTVPPGTCERLVLPILKKSKVKQFYFAHCPERAIPGKTVFEIIHNDRIIGGIDEKSSEKTKDLYSSFVKGEMYITDIRSAEFVKLMENTYRDVNIALANEFAQIAEEVNIDVWDAIELANKHPRVNILKPGPGVGGHCIAIDPWFLTENSTKFRIIPLARQINDSMPNYILHLARELLKDIREPIVTVLGAAYKGDVDDTRETPASKFIKLAENEGFTVRVHDPYVTHFEHKIFELNEAIKDSDCLVLITDHSVFKELNPVKLSKQMKTKIVVDTRNILDHEKWKKAGFLVKVLGKTVI